MFRRKDPAVYDDFFMLDQGNLKAKINKNLACIVKEVQKEFPSGSPVTKESTNVQYLCSILESAFVHGLKPIYLEKNSSRSKDNLPKPQFWNFILKISHTETTKRVDGLKFITTKIGKCRAWLRITLNDSALTSYFASILSREQRHLLNQFYNSYALFLDSEHADIFLSHLTGLESLPFDLSYNASVLNDWTKTPLELAGLVPPSSSVPLYETIMAKSVALDHKKHGINTKHRGSAPAILLFENFHRPSSGHPWSRPQEQEESPQKEKPKKSLKEKPIEEKDETGGKENKPEEEDEDSVLHKRTLRKRRKKSVNSLRSSRASLRSGESSSGSSKTNSRTGSFKDDLSAALLLKKQSEMVESKTADSENQPSSGQAYKNENLMLTPGKDKAPTDVEDRPEKLDFESIYSPNYNTNSSQESYSPRETTTEHTYSSSSSEIAKKLTSSSSSDGYQPTTGDTAGLKGHDYTNSSTEAIDIYSSSYKDKGSTAQNNPENVNGSNYFTKMGNSLSRDGGWSAPNTPDAESRVSTRSFKSGRGSSFSQNAISSLEEAHEPIKWSTPENFSEKNQKIDVEIENEPELFIRREGFLKKMGETLKQWKTRYFILRGQTLSYFKEKEDSEPMGVIDLSEVLSIAVQKTKGNEEIVMTMIDNRQHHIAAEDKAVTHDWAEDFKLLINVKDECTDPVEKNVEEDIYSKNYLEEYEIISVGNKSLKGLSTSWHASMVALMGKIANERGLDAQNYQCIDCAAPVGIIYGASRVCNFTGQYYCSQCHGNDEAQIPSRIVHNWDFRKHKVCKQSKAFLDREFSQPHIDMSIHNAGIYKYIDEMGKIFILRQQLIHLKPYLQTCRSFDMEDVVNKLSSRLHFLESCHLYSVQDLCNVNDKSVINLLAKIVKTGMNHVFNCPLCSAKGFVCEVCRDNRIIFPFQTNITVQCFDCKGLFHTECKTDSCPRCERRQTRLLKQIQSKDLESESD